MVEVERDGAIEEKTLTDLLRRAQSGADPQAFDALYLLYADRVYRYLLARAGDADTAEEASAQIFLHLMEQITKYDIAPKDNVAIFSAWLYRLSYNKMIDLVRRQQRTRWVDLEHAERTPTGQMLAEQVIERIEFERVWHKLRLLNEQQRTVIVLRFLEGFSIAETAAIMGKTDGAVKALQHRSLENLRQYLQDKTPDDI